MSLKFKDCKFFILACIVTSFFALAGCGGGGGSDGGSTAGSGTGTTTSGDVSINGNANSETSSFGSIKANVRAQAVPNAEITCGYFDPTTKTFTPLSATATADASGSFKLASVPQKIGTWEIKNFCIIAKSGTTKYRAVIPDLSVTSGASVSTLVNAGTDIHFQVLESCVGQNMSPDDVSIGDMVSALTDEVISQIGQDPTLIATFAFSLKYRADALKAVSSADFDTFKKKSLEVFRKIQDGAYWERINQSTNRNFAQNGDKLFKQMLASGTLGIPGNVMEQFNNIDQQIFMPRLQAGFQGSTVFKNNTTITGKFEQTLEAQKYIDEMNAMISAIKAFKGFTGLTSDITDDTVVGMTSAFQNQGDALRDISKASQFDAMANSPAKMIIQSIMQKIFAALKLFDGGLMAKIMITEDELKAKGLSWYPLMFTPGFDPKVGPTTPPVIPTPEQMQAFHKARAEILTAKIKLYLTTVTLTEEQIKALIYFLTGPIQIGFNPANFTSTGGTSTGPATMQNQIMGIIKAITPVTVGGKTYAYSIEPPTGFPAGPTQSNGLLGLLRADTGVTITKSATNNVVDSYLVAVEFESAPSGTNPSGFLVKSIKANDASAGGVSINVGSIKLFGKLVSESGAYFLKDPSGVVTMAKVVLSGDLLNNVSKFLNQFVGLDGTPSQVPGATYPEVKVNFMEIQQNVGPVTTTTGGTTTGGTPTGTTTTNPDIQMQGLLGGTAGAYTLSNTQVFVSNSWAPGPPTMVLKAGTVTETTLAANLNANVTIWGPVSDVNGVKTLTVNRLEKSTGPIQTAPTLTPATGIHGPVTFEGGRFVINKGGTGQAFLVSKTVDLNTYVGKFVGVPEGYWITDPTKIDTTNGTILFTGTVDVVKIEIPAGFAASVK